MKDYKLNTYANGFGIWHCEILFSSPMGNTGQAEKVISNAITNAKRAIRREIQERMSSKTKRLSYEIAENVLLSTNQMLKITIREK